MITGLRRRSEKTLVALGLAALASCSSIPPRPYVPRSAQDFDVTSADAPDRLSGLYVQGVSAPYVSIDTDIDGLGSSDLRSGNGSGIAAGVLKDGLGIGVFVLRSEHKSRAASSDADLQASFIEARLVGRSGYESMDMTLQVGLGLGWGELDFEKGSPFSDAEAALFEARIELGILIGSLFSFDLGVGYMTDLAEEDLEGGTYVILGLSAFL